MINTVQYLNPHLSHMRHNDAMKQLMLIHPGVVVLSVHHKRPDLVITQQRRLTPKERVEHKCDGAYWTDPRGTCVNVVTINR